jgi:hypothetical protein
MHIPMFVLGALILGVLFDLPAFNIAIAIIGAGLLVALMH